MDSNTSPEVSIETDAPKAKKPLCLWSILCFAVSLIAFGAYCLVLGLKARGLIPVWVILGIVSVFTPAVSKHIRLSKDQSGRFFEIAALVIGGYAFAMIIFLLTKWPMFFWYLGWIVGGFIYKAVKQ